MPIAAPAEAEAETDSQSARLSTSSAATLVQRVSAEVDAAAERVNSLQAEAARVFLGREKLVARFADEAGRIDATLQLRLDAFLKVPFFNDIEKNLSLEPGPGGSGFLARTTTLSVPYSDRCSAKVVLSFRVGHDGPIENAVVDYRLEILPIFLKFESHDQLVIPINQPSEETIAAWIDDKLVEFTRTYFEVYFHSEYQKKSFEMDPVMNIQFPRMFAARKKEYEGRIYHFYTNESFAEFEAEPSKYVPTT